MARQYRSFSEIDERLKVLELQREIHKESLKLHLNRVKHKFYPTQLAGGFSGIIQKIALTYAIKKISKIFRKRRPATTGKQLPSEKEPVLKKA